MIATVIFDNIVNIVPLWTSQLGGLIGFGNEYNVLVNVVLQEIIRLSRQHITDIMIFVVLFGLVVGWIGYKAGLLSTLSCWIAGCGFVFHSTNQLCIVGAELYANGQLTLVYGDHIKALNGLLSRLWDGDGDTDLRKELVRTYYDNEQFTWNAFTKPHPIAPTIWLHVIRSGSLKDAERKVQYMLSSTNDQLLLVDWLNTLMQTEHDHHQEHSMLSFIGKEVDGSMDYSVAMTAINWYAIHHRQYAHLNHLSCLAKDTFVLQSVNQWLLYDDPLLTIWLSVVRKPMEGYTQVEYKLQSKTKDTMDVKLTDWVQDVIAQHRAFVTGQYKYWKLYRYKLTVRSSGVPSDFRCSPGFECITNWVLTKYPSMQYNLGINCKLLNPIDKLEMDQDVFLTVVSGDNANQNKDKHTFSKEMYTGYILQSNTVDLDVFMINCTHEYDEYLTQLNANKLYHLVYKGHKEGLPTFSKVLLSEIGNELELFETFDKMFNEHTQRLMKDLDQLHDLEYYRKYGLKRKKGYLFHGVPGCGKTASVVAMALYDNRHIVEIPLSLVKSVDHLDSILNATCIESVNVRKDKMIILFDEIDVGMPKRIGSSDDASTVGQLLVNALKNKTEDKDGPDQSSSSSSSSSSSINLGSFLSKLDGIGNYNGLVTIGTTNCIESLDPAVYRELRLSPIQFDKLLKVDCIRLVEFYLGDKQDKKEDQYQDQEDAYQDLVDRQFTPVQVVSLLQQHMHLTPAQFCTTVLLDKASRQHTGSVSD